MAYNLRDLAKRAGNRRRLIKLRPIRVRPASVRELERITALALEPWESNTARIVGSYRAPGYTGMRDSAEETSRLIELIVLETNRALVRITARIKTWAGGVERIHRKAWAESVLAATSIDLTTILSPFDMQETVEAAIQRNASLVKNVSEATRGRIADIVFRGVQQRTPTRDVAKQLREAVDLERKRSVRIAADQATKLYSALDRARQEEAGIEHFIWRHSRKARPRAAHVARDGVLYKWRAGIDGPGRDPPPQGDFPGELPFCGCQPQAVILDDSGKPI